MKRHTEPSRPESGSPLRFAILCILAGLLVLATLPVLAQDTESEEAAEAEEEAVAPEDMISDVITVTARKREESLQEVPVAVSVIEGEMLEDAGAADISEIQADVPNLSIFEGRGQSTTMTAFMRGVGQADPLWGVDPGVGLYLDDVYIARPQGALLDVYDVERIEVLRGPQGTLYGKNTIGGAIKFVSKPLSDTPEGRISLTGGEFGTQDFKFSISGPIAPGKLRGKLAFASLQRDGYGTNLFTGRDVSDKDINAFRVGLDWLPSENVTVKLRYDQTEDNAEPKGLTRLEPNFWCPAFLGATCPPLPDNFDTEAGLDPANGTDSEGYSLVIEWNINDSWLFKSITAHRESDTRNNIDFDTTPAEIADTTTFYFDEQDSQEFQFVYTGGARLKGVLGLYYFDGFAGGLVPFVFLRGNPFINPLFGITDGDTDTESLAVFGDGSYAINDRLTFNFGLRFTEEDKNGRAFNAFYSDDTYSQVIAVAADYDETETFSSVSPRLGLDYRFNDDVMGYISLSRGFKSGGFNVRANAAAFPDTARPFEDEELTVAEVGVKSVLANRSLILNTALFTGDYTDIQVDTFTSFDSDGDGQDDAFFGNFLNAGDATISGLEVELDWTSQTATWLGLSGNLSFLDADADFLDEDGDGFVDVQVIKNAPEFTGALNLNVNAAAWGGLISGSLGVAYRDDSVLTNEGGPDPFDPTQSLLPIVQPSFDLWNVWIGWLSGDGKWRFSITGKNLTDEEYLTNGYNLPTLGVLTGSFGQPRTVTASLEYRFF
ncbi:MAG: TonB-dependent receptor [bacterium]|nr:TonB-dependent receptor [bacterium]